MNSKIFSIITVSLCFIFLSGCAKIWQPVFVMGKKAAPTHYAKSPYYDGPHQLCHYEGRHVHDPKLGPISITETNLKVIGEKYRYPGMEDQFKELDSRVW